MSVLIHIPLLVPPPSVSLSPPLTGVFTDQSVVLTCTILLDSSVDTSVTVIVQWFNPASTNIDNTMTTMQSTPLTYQSTTTLSDFMTGDIGTYTCVAVVTSSRGFTTPSDSVSASTEISLSKSFFSLSDQFIALPCSSCPLCPCHCCHCWNHFSSILMDSTRGG